MGSNTLLPGDQQVGDAPGVPYTPKTALRRLESTVTSDGNVDRQEEYLWVRHQAIRGIKHLVGGLQSRYGAAIRAMSIYVPNEGVTTSGTGICMIIYYGVACNS